MAKRTASKQLTQDNWNDDDDDKESPGVYKSVDASVLQNRVIKRAKRFLPEAHEKAAQSPFSQFGGFGDKVGNSVPSLGLLMNICGKSTLSLSQATNVENSEAKQNGRKSSASELAEKNNASSALKNSGGSSFSAQDSASVRKPLSRDVEYYRHLKALNESVLQWLQMHTEKNPWCDLTPVFNDYRKHITAIEQKYPLKEKSLPKVSKPFSFKVPSLPVQKAYNAAPEENLGAGEPAAKATKLSSMSSADISESTGMWYGAGFKSSTTNTSTFSFGIKATTTATVPSSNSGPTSSCGSSEKDKKENELSPFSFSVAKSAKPSSNIAKLSGKSDAKPFSFAVSPVCKDSESQQKNGTNEEEEDDYVPPKSEVINITEEDALYSKRCKLFYKNDGSYKEKGVGSLYLKPRGRNTQLLIRGGTVTGKILLNINLHSSLPMQRLGKNNVLVTCIPNPPLTPGNSASKETVSFLIRTKTEDDADELYDMLRKYKS